MTKPIVLVIAGFFLTFFLFATLSCNKNTECKATIKCVDSIGVPLNNVAVLLYATVKTPSSPATYTADLKANGNTDASGEVHFTFKLPAIYDISATYSATKTYTGSGIIKLEEGKNVDKTVVLK
jgi:hypothetical protein